MSLPKIRNRWLLLLAIIVLLSVFPISFAVRRISELRETAKAMSCNNNYKQVVFALYNYHDVYNSMPPARATDAGGTPIHSWRALLEPFLEAGLTHYSLKEPWDGPHNHKLAHGLPIRVETLWPEEAAENPSNSKTMRSGTYTIEYSCFRCPCQNHIAEPVTDMVAVVGELTAWPESKRIRFEDITDPHDTTILIVEINHSDILWSEPRDMDFDKMQFEINSQRGPSISSPHRSGPAVAFADGTVARLGETIPPEMVKAMLTIAGGEKIDKEEMKRKGWLR